MRAALLAVCLPAVLSAAAFAQPTAITYQGRVKNGTALASGLHDFRFTLFDAASGGAPVGTTQCMDNVVVTEGLFTAVVDFGQQFATPSPRFLQIEVRADTGLNCTNGTGFVVLAPRQALTAAPLANSAKSAFSLSAADGSPANAVFVDNNGNVGIGTTTPGHSVTIANPAPTIALQDTDSTTQQVGYISYRDSGNVERGWVGYGSVGDPDLSIINARPGGDIVLNTFGGGLVGIGTAAPGYLLHVSGGAIAVSTPAVDQADALVLGIERSWAFRQQGTGAATALKLQSIGGGGNKNFLIDTTGFVGIGTLSPQAKLDVAGTARVQVLEITGADLAERFPASEPLAPGMVVAIDRENPGQLCLSRSAYNRTVAGVVSGANEFAAGAILGNLPGHDDAPAVALTGRVYVWCDAGTGPIEPGDMLTTSETPGHAMRADDYSRAQGAIIGKAMTSLPSGRGMVLVLVNLQ
ncbi:MAG: hypothetical protein JNM80_15415 [Phycisphaerae bacterium]|nr:hypothetical protein [Phycisphaerae bacterium]